jgi:phospholipid/cholesterol/gamma-HCH transport system substrate-binding protein
MSARANYFKLGLFIICGLLLGLIAVVILGAGRLLERKVLLETYFDQSVQGVDIGSQVKFRGVNVGQIRTIDFTRNFYQLDRPRVERQAYVRIVAEIRADALGGMAEGIVHENLEREIENGLRVRLALLGLTGTAYLDVDYLDPQRFPPLPIDWEPIHPYVPSAPSTLSRIVDSLEHLVVELDRIDFQALAGKAEQLLDNASSRIEAMDTPGISAGFTELLSQLGESAGLLQSWLTRPELESTIHDASSAMSQLRQATANPALTNSLLHLELSLRRLDHLLANTDDPLRVTLENLRVASENLREVTDNARRYPSQLLFGEPPRPSRHNP